MSGRGATAAVKAEWAKDRCGPVHLLELDFDPWIYLTDAGTNLSYNGNTYLASQFLGFSSISETSDLLVNSVTVSLSGVDQAVVAILLQESYLNRKMKIRTAMLDAAYAIYADPVLIFDGRMNRPTVSVDTDNGTALCAVEGVSHWTDFDRRGGRHSNDAEQRKFFPGDKGFAQVPVIPEQIFWGIVQEIANAATPPSRPGPGPAPGGKK